MADIQHKDLPDSQRHEPKGISTATDGQVYLADGIGSGVWSDFLPPNYYTGWAQYNDETYTEASPLSVPAGTRTKLTIDAASVLEDQLPLDAAAPLWDSVNNKITPISEGDAYDLRIVMTVEAGGTDPYTTIQLDIGGTMGVIMARTIPHLKATAEFVTIAAPIYTASTFLANGGELYVTPVNATDYYDISVLLTRTHKGR